MDIKTYDVIIPFYSGSEWLDEAISSALAQTYPASSIIVVNDGSKEDISSIEKKYEGRVCFYYKENGGAATARNYGIKKSTSDAVFFLDSDDLWLPEKAEKQINLMNQEELMWSSTAYKTFGGKKEGIVAPYQSDKPCWEHIYNSCRIQTSNVAVRRECFNDSNNLFAENMKNGQDIYVWFRLAHDFKLGVINEPLVLFRIRGNNTQFSYVSHVRVRALLWKKMEEGLLSKPNHRLTKMGYCICNRIYDKYDGIIPQKRIIKFQFGIAWLIFRISNLFVK